MIHVSKRKKLDICTRLRNRVFLPRSRNGDWCQNILNTWLFPSALLWHNSVRWIFAPSQWRKLYFFQIIHRKLPGLSPYRITSKSRVHKFEAALWNKAAFIQKLRKIPINNKKPYPLHGSKSSLCYNHTLFLKTYIMALDRYLLPPLKLETQIHTWVCRP